MPAPTEGEDKATFVRRCIPIVLKDKTAKDSRQAVAVCTSMWNNAKVEGSRGGELLTNDPKDSVEQVFISSI